MTTAKLSQILKDENLLAEYVDKLEEDINTTNIKDEQIDELLNNILKRLDNFNDPRSIRSTLIDSVANLIRLKTELPEKRIKVKQQILNILTKKQELEIKTKQAQATQDLATGAIGSLQLIFDRLDKLKIHPTQLTDKEITEQCSNIIDLEATKFSVEEAPVEKPKPKKSKSVAELQQLGE